MHFEESATCKPGHTYNKRFFYMFYCSYYSSMTGGADGLLQICCIFSEHNFQTWKRYIQLFYQNLFSKVKPWSKFSEYFLNKSTGISSLYLKWTETYDVSNLIDDISILKDNVASFCFSKNYISKLNCKPILSHIFHGSPCITAIK